MKKYDPFTPYFTTVDTINMSEEETIGSLTRDDVVTLLKEIQKAMTLQYYNKVYNFGQTPPGPGYNLLEVKGGQLTETGDQWKFTVVHSDGEYGVYKLGVTQLIDAGMFGGDLNNWISNNLPNIPVPSKGNEEYESWYSRFVKYNRSKQTRIIEAPVNSRNNALYYMLIYPINGGDPRFNVSVHPHLATKNSDGALTDHGDMHGGFIENPFLQDLAASNLLKFTYQLLLTSRAITESVDKKTLAGALALSLCWDIDSTQNYLRGNIKTDTSGVSAKYWFDVGYNAVALPAEKVATPGPIAGTTSVVKDEEVTPPADEPETPVGQTTVETVKTSNSPVEAKEVPKKIVKTINNGTLTYELTSNGTISAKVVTAVKKSVSVLGSGGFTTTVTNPFSFIQNGIVTTLEQLGAETFKLTVVDRVENGRVLFEGSDSDSANLASTAATKLNQIKTAERDSLHGRGSSGTWLLAIETVIEWLPKTYPSIVTALKQLKTTNENTKIDDVESNKTIAFDDPADIETLVKQLDAKAQEADRSRLKFTYDACISAKNEIQTNFTADTQTISSAISQATETSADGSSTSSVSTVQSSGAVTTVTTTTDADGTVTQTKTVEKVDAPLKSSSPNTLDNGIEHNTRSAEPTTQVNSASANALPTHEGTNVEKPIEKGFADPNKSYPKPDYVNKPDTNTLALGVNSKNINPDPRTSAGDKSSQSLGSSPAARNASRKRAVKMAGRSGSTWEQPATPYAAKYPYNKVFAGESGHALEIDDTPGFERLNLAHRSGTFMETGPDGTQVNKIIGNGYSIIEKDGFVLIEGNANVHIAGQCNVFIMNDTALTMHGKVSLDIHNDVNVNIGGSLGLSVQDGIYLRNEGDISVKNEGKVDAEITGAVTTKTTGKYNLTTDAGLNLTSKVNTHIKSGGSFFNHSTGNMNLCTDAELLAKSTGDINLKTAAMINQESTGNVNIKTAGTINAESAGNISLKAPLIASSPIDTPTLDVTTANITTLNVGALNAGTTNLRATGTDTGTNGGSTHDLPISGPSSITASVTAPASAGSAEDAVCAVAAKLPVTYELEKPVSLSASQPVERTVNTVTTGYDGENDIMNSDGDDTPPAEGDNPNCVNTDGDPSTAGNDTVSNDTGDPETSTGMIPNKSGVATKSCNIVTIGGKSVQLTPLSGKYDGNLQLSPNFKLKDLCVFPSNGCPDGWKGLRASPHGHTVADIINNLRCLCVNILEPTQEKWGKLKLSCAYRSHHPSRGGRDPGAHGYGAAADIEGIGGRSKKEFIKIAKWITENCKHDQILLEFTPGKSGSGWIHVGWVYRDGKQRAGMSGTMVGPSGKYISKGYFKQLPTV
jgi:hypothetical protein